MQSDYKKIIDLATSLETVIQENIQQIRNDRWGLFAVTQQNLDKTLQYSEFIRNVTKIARQGIVEVNISIYIYFHKLFRISAINITLI